MTSKDFDELVKDLEAQEHELLFCKGKEYTVGSDDRLYNFKNIAKLLGVNPLVVWAVYFMKHIYSILNYVKEGDVVSNEPIESRFCDARNYLVLGLALIKDNK